MMAIKQKPFTQYRDRDIQAKDDTFTVRLNPTERVWLEELKEDFNIKSDGKALKLAGLVIGRNVLHQTFSRSLMKYLFKKDRQRLEDFKDF
jgi:hypothetical protein